MTPSKINVLPKGIKSCIIHLLIHLVLCVLGKQKNRHLYGLSGLKPAHEVVNRLITTHLHVN